MAEKLRATTTLLQRDLAADHFEGKKRLSDPNFWLYGPPQQGFLQILQGGPAPGDTPESAIGDASRINSFRSTNHSLAFTIKLRGNQMGDFLTAGPQGGGAVLNGIATFGPPEARYQLTSGGGSYNYQWAEVAWFMVAQLPTDVTVTDPATGAAPQQLYTLYRRQRLLVPDNSLVPQQPAGNLAQYQEVSCWANGGNLYFNGPIDITDPQRRFGGGVGTYTPIPQGQGSVSGSDIQLTNVLSFDVRVFSQHPAASAAFSEPFVTLFQAPFTSYAHGNPTFFPANANGPAVFDTWTSISDGLGNSYAQWNVAGQGTSIPLWNGTTGPLIQAIQISIRIWDAKTNQTREVTIVQAM
jgi:hypothetical protein